MKRLTSLPLLSLLAAISLAAVGCKHDSAKQAPAAGEATARSGPLLLPSGPGLGGQAAAGTGSGSAAAPTVARRAPQARGWGGGDRAFTPEELIARRADMAQERESRRKEMLDTYDANHDGQLDDQERLAMHETRITEMIGRLDSDGDGKVSRTELAAVTSGGGRPMPDFDRMDLDKDGFITGDEMMKVMPQRGPRGARGFGRDPGPDQPGGAGSPPPMQPPE